MKKLVTRGLNTILSLMLIVSIFIFVPSIRAKADMGPAGIIVTIKDSDDILKSYNDDYTVSAYRGTTVSFDLKLKNWPEEGGGTREPATYDGVILEGIVSNSNKVVIDNDKHTITIAKDAPESVKIALAYRKYDSNTGKYTDEFNDYDGYGPVVTLNILDKADAYNSYFSSNTELSVSKGLVAGGNTVISTKWNGSAALKPADIKLSVTNKKVSLKGNKLSAKASIVEDTSCLVRITAKLGGVNVSTEANVDVYAKYRLEVSASEVIKLGKSTTLKPYLMARTATKTGIKEKKSAIKKSDKVSYKSSNKKIATVNKKGKVTAAINKTGNSDITVSVTRAKKKYTAKATIFVEESSAISKSVKVKKPSKNGKKIKVACWNDEFQRRIEFILKSYPEYKDMVEFTIVPSDDNAYQKYLKSMESGKEPVADIILAEADYMDFALDLKYTVPVSKIGYKEAWYGDAYPYTREIGTKDGKLYALSWQACPSTFIYNKSIAKSVFGTADSSKIQAKVKDWNTFLATGKTLKAKNLRILSSNELIRQYVGGSSKHMTSGKNVYLGGTLDKYISFDKALVSTCGVPVSDLWSDEWGQGFLDNKTFGYFGPQWFYDFCMCADDPSSVASKYGWGICEGPSDTYWGGTWIIPTNAGRNNELVTFLLAKLTADDDMMYKIHADSNDFMNNMAVNNKIMTSKNTAAAKKEMYKIYDKVAKKIPAKHESIYYQGTYESISESLRDYLEGNISSVEELKKIITASIKEKYPDAVVNTGGTGKEAKKISIKSYNTAPPKKGDIVLTTDKSGVYVVSKISKKKVASVSYLRPLKRTASKANIPATVKLTNGTTVKVTGISKNAFKGCEKLKKVSVGKNIKAVGANAFMGVNENIKIKCHANSLKVINKNRVKAKIPESATIMK